MIPSLRGQKCIPLFLLWPVPGLPDLHWRLLLEQLLRLTVRCLCYLGHKESNDDNTEDKKQWLPHRGSSTDLVCSGQPVRWALLHRVIRGSSACGFPLWVSGCYHVPVHQRTQRAVLLCKQGMLTLLTSPALNGPGSLVVT